MKKPESVETVAKARALSLIKWRAVKVLCRKLFNEINTSCGFCDLGRHRAGKRPMGKCEKCGVDVRCHAIQDVAKDIECNLEKVINGTIDFLEDMDVKKK